MNNSQEEYRVDGKSVRPHSLRNHNMESGSFLVKSGLAADLPTTGDEYPFYFATDTGVFYAWNGSAWLSTTLT